MEAMDLDGWLPDPVIVTRHRRAARAEPEVLWAAASALRLDHTRALGRLVRWRIPGVAPDQSFRGLFAEEPFTILDAGARHLVSGLCGRIWTLARDYPPLAGPDEFRGWNVPLSARVLFAHWVVPGADGRSTLHSEARVGPTDAAARRRLRALWLAVGPFEWLIGAEALALAVTRAESAAGG